MRIDEMRIKVSEVYNGYFNDDEEGVVGFGGQLDIRPKYQREFVYKPDQQQAVIRTVLNGLPLNVMYWVDRWADPDHPTEAERGEARYELLDGQQRTLSLCSYMYGDFSVDGFYFHNLPADRKKAIEDYPLFVYVCNGTESEKLDWFEIINIAGERLTDQERRNAVYAGPWTASAKRYFSKTGGPAVQLAGDYLKGSAIRQEYLETAISWAAAVEGQTIEQYMSIHQHDANAIQLWNYFRSVIEWVQGLFPHYRKEMKGLPWGLFYNQHGQRTDLDAKKLEAEIQRLIADEDVTRKSGVYEYLLSGDVRCLSIRAFDRRDRLTVFEQQGHRCAICGKVCAFEDMHGDHILPWTKGGHTTPDNLQMLCATCNLRKGGAT